MQRGESDNDYLSDNFWKGKPIDDDRSSEKIANSFGNQFAHLFTDEESITPQMPKIFEQKHLNASNPTPNEM
uniref:Uncharacterized protein n=1 Tax=Ascaris lumbricoides TaxID=6252 RepID=A0A0M3IEZ8_ASCLU